MIRYKITAENLKELQLAENAAYVALDKIGTDIKQKRPERKPGERFRAYMTAELKKEWKE